MFHIPDFFFLKPHFSLSSSLSDILPLSLYKVPLSSTFPVPLFFFTHTFYNFLCTFPFSKKLQLFKQRHKSMSSRRQSRISEAEINELVSKLQNLLPESRRRGSSRSSAKLLKETCNYIKSLHREVDDLSDRLSDLMAGMDDNSAQAEILRSLLGS